MESAEQRRFRTKDAWAGAKFALAWLVVRNSHLLGLLCEIRTCLAYCAKFALSLMQLSSEGHIFLFQLQIVHGLSVGFLTSWALKWYIACRKWTSGSAPKVPTKTAAAVLCFPPCFSLLFSFDWLVLMIQKDVKTLKLATNMIRSHC